MKSGVSDLISPPNSSTASRREQTTSTPESSTSPNSVVQYHCRDVVNPRLCLCQAWAIFSRLYCAQRCVLQFDLGSHTPERGNPARKYATIPLSW